MEGGPEAEYQKLWGSAAKYLEAHYSKQLDWMHRRGYTLDPDTTSEDEVVFVCHDENYSKGDDLDIKAPSPRLTFSLEEIKRLLEEDNMEARSWFLVIDRFEKERRLQEDE